MLYSLRRFWFNLGLLLGKHSIQTADGEDGATLRTRRTLELGLQIVLTIGLLGGGVSILLRPDSAPAAKEWASGALGLVLGYWFR